ncbi:MAG: S41 family peptidase [Gemmatimonadetes bacterium]|nr:S41 family peptidase [Gemmatimonadota bacterium]
MKHRRPILIALLTFVGFLSGGWFFQGPNSQANNARQRARVFESVLRYVAEYYVDSLDPGQLYDMATEGMLDQLQDPYTSFLRETSFEELSISTTGDYGGVGLRIDSRDGWIQVVSPIADSPAARAGLVSGDQIVEVEGQSTHGWSTPKAAHILRGEPGTDVSITVRRAGFADSLNFTITRGKIHVNSVEGTKMVAPKVGYLHLTTVSRQSTSEVLEAITQLRSQGAEGIIFDLRFNPGGILEEGAALADLFLDQGQVIVETRGRGPSATETYVAKRSQAWPDMPMVVLVNRATASAAEIISGALQDHDRAIVLGSPTFGKGVAYLLIEVTDNQAVTITSSRWYTPSGRSIQRGISGSRALNLIARQRAPDSMEVNPEPTEFRTDAGRLIDAGDGGIQPDIFLPRDTLTDGEQLFFATIGSKLPDYRNVLTRYARELKGQNAVVDPEFDVTDGMLSTILQSLRATGIGMPDSIFEGGRSLVAEQFGLELTRYAFSREAELRRSAATDNQIIKAIELLQQAGSTEELLALAAQN